MVAREIERIIWAKEALKSVLKYKTGTAGAGIGAFTDDVPFENYPKFIGETSRDDEDLI